MNKPVIMIGNGGHASVLTEILLSQNVDIIGYTVPDFEPSRFNLSYLGADEVIHHYLPSEVELVLGIGMVNPSALRERVFNSFKKEKFQFRSVIHPSTIISPSVILGEGVQLMAGVIVQTNTIISDNSIINTGSLIEHDCRIAPHVHIAPGVKISGNVSIQKGTHIGTGTTIIQGIEIGSKCLIGAGSVVVKNIANNMKVMGVPAKEV